MAGHRDMALYALCKGLVSRRRGVDCVHVRDTESNVPYGLGTIQHMKLTNTLRILMGEEVIDHSGLDYYEDLGERPPADAPQPYRNKDTASPRRG